MRRGLASLIMGLALLVASASWAAFIMSRTVLDPGRSERLAEMFIDDPDFRAVIVDRLADGVEAQVPTEVPITRDTIEAGADAALDDPAVEAVVREGIVRAHRNALIGNDDPVMLDAPALGAAGRDAIVDLRPELDPLLPASPELTVELPSSGLAWFGTVKHYVDRFTLLGAVVAIVGMASAFVLARNRAAALRRVAFWAFGASAFWLTVAYALPWVLGHVAPSSVSITMAAIDVFFGAMTVPALVLAAIGVALLVVSFAWPALERRRPAVMLDRGVSRPSVPAPVAVAAAAPVASHQLRPRRADGWPSHHVTPQPASYEPAVAAPTPPTVVRPRPIDGSAVAGHPVGSPGPAAAVPAPGSAPATPPGRPVGAGAPRANGPRPRRPIDLGRRASDAPAVPVDAPPTLPANPVADGPVHVPPFEVDDEAAAAMDDLGAEWVEGIGYVGEEPGPGPRRSRT